MYSIGEVAKLTKVTARTLRHYEDKGLISSSRKGPNGYRYYSVDVISNIAEIKKFKSMEFSLNEIKAFFKFDKERVENQLSLKMNKKLAIIDIEVKRLLKSKQEIQDQLLATDKFFKGGTLAKDQRRVLMEVLKKEILNDLKERKDVNYLDLDYLKREDCLLDSKEKRDYIKAIEKCIKFAKDEKIRLGPVRGAASSILSFYAMGISDFDPISSNLIPERFFGQDLSLHIDVEFKHGRRFIDYCRKVTQDLSIGCIEAFKLPILDIIENVHLRIGKVIDYNAIDDNDPLIIDLFQRGDIEFIFSFDIPKNTQVAQHYDDYYIKEGKSLSLFQNYLQSQKIESFKDITNIESIFRLDCLDKHPQMQEFIDRYPLAKKNGFQYDCLSSSLNEYLKPNYGVIIYHEDILKIISEYTSWDYIKCNTFRLKIRDKTLTEIETEGFLKFANKKVLNLLLKEAPVTFCKSHAFGSWRSIVKTTVVLKSLYQDIYLEEIKKWELENGFSWGDFGFISGEASLVQQ